ncbi:nitroreductase/quinone reductase family protein [Streptomyces sp. N2-109]|uniref:Nitroreductase/quinone reductase family protein n=1 Tax=Streptomyces gossypii TaxID=2883101 RepID=A0ABT2JV60_9ACTN|nr:nitroreductase/quinone reductase family protein [Streptomyces gossypii]MCT2591780.1 nitroreductase/quinone reductase family protein [Streptomyces gossypii]
MSEQRADRGLSWNEQVIKEFRENNGAVGGMFEGAPLVLLTTVGRKSRKPHTNPVIHLRDGERHLVFGSNAGSDKHPDWYHNLLASPQVTMEIGTEDGAVKPFATRAVPLEGEERHHYWELQCSLAPPFRRYEEQTDREIPVVALYPLDLSAESERTRPIGQQLIAHHQDLRAELARVRAEIEGALTGGDGPEGVRPPAAGLTEELRRRCLTYCYGLQLHHIREDGAFSAFERQWPWLGPAIERLRAEHRVVEEALAGFEELLEQARNGETDAAAVHDELEKVTGGLEDHFAYEERVLLPALDQSPSPSPPSP